MSDSLQPQGLYPTSLLCPMEFSRQEYWSGLLFPSPGDLSNPRVKPGSPALQTYYLRPEPPGKPKHLTWVHPVSSKRYPSRFESRAGFFASTRDGCLSPRVCLECNPEIPVAPGEEQWLLDTSLDDVYWPCSHSRAIPSTNGDVVPLAVYSWAGTWMLVREQMKDKHQLEGKFGSCLITDSLRFR